MSFVLAPYLGYLIKQKNRTFKYFANFRNINIRWNFQIYLYCKGYLCRGGGGVFWISSEGGDQRFFLCLKFSIPGFFWIGKLGNYFLGWLDLSRDFWGRQYCCTRKRDDDVPFPRATKEIGDVCTQANSHHSATPPLRYHHAIFSFHGSRNDGKNIFRLGV